jgi:excisionase family DNA binding protein
MLIADLCAISDHYCEVHTLEDPVDAKVLFITPAEAARRLSISRSKAYELVRSGELPARRIGASVRIPVEALERLAHETATEERE